MRRDQLSLLGGIVLVALVVFPAQTPQAQPPPQMEIEIDGVYLLDVTSSMVGLEVGAQDILQKVIDLLLVDIERFGQGKFILMTFANGPHDLDGSGPIQAIYEINIRSERDKLFLKQLLRPKAYGSLTSNPNWPGVYEVVKPAISIGPTGVYKSILLALQMLEQIQIAGGAAYTSTHAQELVVYTDGRNNAPDSPTFAEVLRRLKERHFQMRGQFRFKRYLFSKDPKDLENAQGECAIIQQQGAAEYVQNVVAPDITQLVILRLDRQVLGFPNVWAPSTPEDSRTIVLKGVQIHYEPGKENVLAGGQIRIRPARPQDFSLPPDVTIKVSTEPEQLRFPLGPFDLKITLAPFSRLKEFMKDHSGIEGYLRFEFVPASQSGGALPTEGACKFGSSQELLVDFQQSMILVDLPYVLPALHTSWAVEGDAFSLTLSPNDVFKSLAAKQQMIWVDYNEDHFLLFDDQNQIHKAAERFGPQALRKLRLKIRDELMPGAYAGSLKLDSELDEVLVDGAPFFATGYEFSVIGLDREKLACPNLWGFEISEDARLVTCEFSLRGGLITRGQLNIQVGESDLAKAGIAIDVDPQSLDPPFAERNVPLHVIIKPYSLLMEQEDLQAQINKSEVDAYLLLQFTGASDRAVHIRGASLLLDLVYSPPEVGVTVNGQAPTGTLMDLGTRYRDEAALTLNFAVNEAFLTLPQDQQQIRFEYDTTHFYLTDSRGNRLPENAVNPSLIQSVIFKVTPSLIGERTYEGLVMLTSGVPGLRIAGREGSMSIEYKLLRPAAKVTISDGRTDRHLGRVRAGMTFATFQLEYDETYIKEPRRLKVDYDEQLFALFDDRDNLVKTGSTLSIGETRLTLRANPEMQIGLLSRDAVAQVRFSSEEGVKINGKSSDAFSYSLHVTGWLSTLLWAVGWIALAGLVLSAGAYCMIKRQSPKEAVEELARNYGALTVGVLLVLLLVLWLGGWIAGSSLS